MTDASTVWSKFVSDKSDVEGLVALALSQKAALSLKPSDDLKEDQYEAYSAMAGRVVANDITKRVEYIVERDLKQAITDKIAAVHLAHHEDLQNLSLKIGEVGNVWRNIGINVLGGLVFGVMILLVQRMGPSVLELRTSSSIPNDTVAK